MGKRILILRAEGQGERSGEIFRLRGAIPLHWAAIEVHPLSDRTEAIAAICRIQNYELVLFTSENGVRFSVEVLQEAGLRKEIFEEVCLGAIGSRTAEALQAHGFSVSLIAPTFVAESLVREVLLKVRPGAVLLLRATAARNVLPDALVAAGFRVDDVPVYETRPRGPAATEELRDHLSRGVDAIVFSSASTVASILDRLGDDAHPFLSRTCIAAIGPVTAEALRARGFEPNVTAAVHTFEGVADALERHFAVQV